MAERSTIARPYAKALFTLARAQQQLAAWADVLALAASVVADKRVGELLTNPRVTAAQLADLVIDTVQQAVGSGAKLDEQLRNFSRTLAANRRLGFLPEIAAIFAQLKAEAENSVDVTVTAAVPLTAEQQSHYQQALQKRLNRKVRLHVEIDPKLLGGAILRADDLVIDGSLRGRLERLSAAVTG